MAASGQPFTKRGQAAHAVPPPQPGQTAVGTQRPQKRFFRKGRPTASTPNKPRDSPTLSHPPRPFPLGRGALHCPWGLAGRMCAFGFFLPSADRLGSLQGRQGPGLRPSPGRPVSSLRCGPRQPPLRPLTPFPLEKRSRRAIAARRGRFRGLAYPSHPKIGKTRCSPIPERMRGRFRKRNLKHAKECSIQQRRGFACGVCRWKRRFGCSRNSAVSAARFESGFRERDGQGQHWRGPHSHGGFLKMIVCESGGHANGLTYFIFRFLRRPQHRPLEVLVASHRPRPRRSPIVSDHTGRGQRRRGIFSTAC